MRLPGARKALRPRPPTMTPRGDCPTCSEGLLAALEAAPGFTRCSACNTTFDRLGNAYDVQWRLIPTPRRT